MTAARITLGVACRGKVWRSADPDALWLYFQWKNGQWMCYTDDPRHLRLDSISAPAGGADAHGNLIRGTGFVEVP